MSTVKNAFYAQSGGVTAVINASACGVIQTARKHTDRIGNVFAGRNGIIGALLFMPVLSIISKQKIYLPLIISSLF